ncbi:MAG: 4Fe-4S dicluster domain-containing protein [Deltaproteobacteria bacterium]|nr:4Fe-4S dicluster domain-containing protein [Deltaproteobacteria bacterium]
MNEDRRSFLKLAGLCALGVGAKPVTDAMAGSGQSPYSSKPRALQAKRWGMVVDVKTCQEKIAKDQCRDCIAACHITHNVPEIEGAKEEIKWIWQTPYEHAFPGQVDEFAQLTGTPFMVLCNHCDNPPCVRVCPTKATFKREDGVVMMDFHRCIGCRYCMAACPFGARSFNFQDPRPFIKEVRTEFPTRMRGVVEKCNFCAERLADGLQPACVEACKPKALIFGDLEDPDSDVRRALRGKYAIRRKTFLGTRPSVLYLV